jgi:hypothetical protein
MAPGREVPTVTPEGQAYTWPTQKLPEVHRPAASRGAGFKLTKKELAEYNREALQSDGDIPFLEFDNDDNHE